MQQLQGALVMVLRALLHQRQVGGLHTHTGPLKFENFIFLVNGLHYGEPCLTIALNNGSVTR